MIFQHSWAKVLSGDKTQTRRLVKPGERSRTFLGGKWPHAVDSSTFRQKWRVGNTYAVQPGCGEKAVGRIRLNAIRRERLQEISDDDALAEGIDFYEACPMCGGMGSDWGGKGGEGNHCLTCSGNCVTETLLNETFEALWQGSHAKPGTRWEDNPEVWVLEFELVRSE